MLDLKWICAGVFMAGITAGAVWGSVPREEEPDQVALVAPEVAPEVAGGEKSAEKVTFDGTTAVGTREEAPATVAAVPSQESQPVVREEVRRLGGRLILHYQGAWVSYSTGEPVDEVAAAKAERVHPDELERGYRPPPELTVHAVPMQVVSNRPPAAGFASQPLTGGPPARMRGKLRPRKRVETAAMAF